MTRDARNDQDRRLRAILRAGDPAAGDPIPPADRVDAWRHAMLRAGRETHPAPTVAGWRFASVALAGLALVIGISVWSLVHPPAPEEPVATGAGRALRTIRMTGPGGTRIIWSVNPRLPDNPDRTRHSRTGDRS